MRLFRFASVMALVLASVLLMQVNSARAADPTPARAQYDSMDDLFALYQPYLGNISVYEPVYFLVGTDPAKSKFQISFRYRLFNPKGPLVADHPWVNGLNFGYTQTSFWDLKSASAPFEDTSYKPELFHLTTNQSWRPPWLKGLFLQSGMRHESNGRGDVASRSTNIIYFKPIGIFYDADSKLGLQVSPKVWLYVNNSSEDNADLPDYRGYFALEAKVGQADGLVASTSLSWAKKGGSVQVDLDYPLSHYLSDNLSVYLHLQYVNTLAESLLDYPERTEALRLGLSFVR